MPHKLIHYTTTYHGYTHGMFSSSHNEKDLYHKEFNQTICHNPSDKIVGLADQMIQANDNK